MKHVRQLTTAFALLVVVAACGPGGAPARQESGPAGAPAPAVPQRTLVILARGEPPSLAAKPLQDYSGSLAALKRLFNAMLDYIDEREIAHPYLARALPQLNTDTWQVFPDGTMQTRYQLKAGVKWHDGTPLTANDFVFGWRVYSSPQLGTATSAPIGQMHRVLAPDRDTVVIEWRRLYPDAARLDLGFQALPPHLLEEGLQRADPESFISAPFWTRDYTGLGPYRLSQWIPGQEMIGSAFDDHALGRPKIDQIRVLFTPDANSALALMLSGEAHFVSDFVFFYEDGTTLEHEWAARGGGGTVLYSPSLLRWTAIQQRPEAVNPKALTDVRVRRALAHGMDGQAAVEVTTGGRGFATYTMTSRESPMFAGLAAGIQPRPYDARKVQQHFEEAGFARGPDGFFSAGGEPFKLEVGTDGSPATERENSIYVDSLRKAGVDAFSYVIPVVQLRDRQARALRPGLMNGGLGARALRIFFSPEVPRPENRWAGSNRGGWSSPEYDRLWQQFDTALESRDRIRYTEAMERLLFDEVAIIPNLFTVVVNAHAAGLVGPKLRATPDAGGGILHIETWEWTS